MTIIGIAGNPNSGKSSLFNALTGTTQRVSNYPGVTVERKQGQAISNGQHFTLVDLPGIYSLTAFSQEERVASQFLIDEKPDLIIDVVDAANLERNLYLAIQFIELGVPMVIALNMTDVAERRGLNIDLQLLSQRLGVAVVPTIGHKGHGKQQLLETCARVLDGSLSFPRPLIAYGSLMDETIEQLSELIRDSSSVMQNGTARWAAVKLMENDPTIDSFLTGNTNGYFSKIDTMRKASIERIEEGESQEDASALIAEGRYALAADVVGECLANDNPDENYATERIDRWVCHRFVGPAILVLIVSALFFSVFKISDEWKWIPWFGGALSPTGLVNWLFVGMANAVSGMQHSAPMLHSLLADGMIAGVGGVMSFVPLIFVMFLFISTLEDTGYIARVAFILDRLLRSFGLQGKSILAMLVAGGLGAGGCAVPGVMATRALREDKDRLVTMLVTPFMNCGAKMPVYAMLIAAFFPQGRTQMMLILWAISWVVALCAAWVLRRFVVHGEQTPFVMELPPYHIPTMGGVVRHTWQRTWMYIRKAGTIILALNIILWAMMYFPQLPESQRQSAQFQALSAEQQSAEELSASFAGRFGQALEPISRYAGFDWRTNIALVGGFAAKEVVVGTLGIAYSMGQVDSNSSESLSGRLAADNTWTALKAFSLMIFVMLYAPCFITTTVIRRESGSWKWAAFATVYTTVLAFVCSTLIFQIGSFFGLGT